MSTAQPDILIVGAGIAGAATAYHLAQTSNLKVLIVEKESTAGAHSTGRNAALVREYMENPALRELAREGASFLRTGRLARFEGHGAVLLGLGDRELGQWVPAGRGRGLWCPRDGVVDVAGLLQSYLAGQRVSYHTEVLEWRHTGDKLVVATNRGDIECEVLVNAAGPWAGTLGNLPLTPKNRHIFVSTPQEWVDPGWPFVWDVPNGYYFRPESGGLLLSPCDQTPGEPGDYTEDSAKLEELAEKLTCGQPGLGELAIQSSWVGQRTFAPDREFVIGFDPRDDRVFHVAALGGHGITISYAVGRLAATLLTDRAIGAGNHFRPDRLL